MLIACCCCRILTYTTCQRILRTPFSTKQKFAATFFLRLIGIITSNNNNNNTQGSSEEEEEEEEEEELRNR